MFLFQLPTKVYFGTDIIKDSINKERGFFKENLLIVTTKHSVKRNGYLDELIDILREVRPDVKISVYSDIRNNPDIDEVAQAVEISKTKNIEMVIGFGGGSAIDAAKAIAAGVGSEISVKHMLFEGTEPQESTLPIIAIPTTAGTGTELSKAAIISSRAAGIKSGIRGANIIPKLAIVDAKYTWSVPEKITAETGFDVLAHAIESYVNIKSTEYSRMLSEYAINIVGEYLPKLIIDGKDAGAREKMMLAGSMMGINLKDVGTALPHRMQYPIGARTDTSHGAGLMAIFPIWLKYEYEYSKEKVNNCLSQLGYEVADNGLYAEELMNDFLNKIGGGRTLKQFGLTDASPEELAKAVSGNIANDPLSAQDGIIDKIYREMLEK